MDEKDEVFDLIRSVIMSQKGGVLLKDLNRDYKSMAGEHIPYLKLGYKCMEDVLNDIPEVTSSIDSDGHILYTTSGKNCDHLVALISKQKSTKSKGNSKNVTHKHEKPLNFSKNSCRANSFLPKASKYLKPITSESYYGPHKSQNEGRIKIERGDYDHPDDEVTYKVESSRKKPDLAERESWYHTSKVYSIGQKKQGAPQPRFKNAQHRSDARGNGGGDHRLGDQDGYIINKEVDFPQYLNENGREHGNSHIYESSRIYERRAHPHSHQSMHDSRIYRTNAPNMEPSNTYDERLHYCDYYNDRLSRNYDMVPYLYSDEQASHFHPKNFRTSRTNYPQDYWNPEYDEHYMEKNPYYPSHNSMRSRYGPEDDYYWDVQVPRPNSQKYGGISGDAQWKENGSSGFYNRKIDVVSGNLLVTIKNS